MGHHSNLPWHRLYNWNPFKIDALGLVTLLGAEEINSSLGRLVPSRYLEYLPLLGAFVIAGERFKEKLTSFNFYNITDGIHTNDLTFWLTRWMVEQEFEQARSVVYFEVAERPRSWLKWHLVSILLAVVSIGFLIAMTLIIGDWYGFANAIAMIISIITRAYSMQSHRNAVDRAVEEADNNAKQDPNHGRPATAKCIIVMSDSKAVTVFLPGHLVVPVFVYNPEPADKFTYHLIRYIGWAVFGVHIVTIGMAQLVPQLYTVCLMVIPTVLTCWKLGCDDSKWLPKFARRILGQHPRSEEYECWIGTRLKAFVCEWPVEAEFEFHKTEIDPNTGEEGRWVQPFSEHKPPETRSKKRQDLYAWLDLTADEEQSLGKWDLLPHTRNGNESWWKIYNAKKALVAGRPIDMPRRPDPSPILKRIMTRKTGVETSTTETSGTSTPTLTPPQRARTRILGRNNSRLLAPNGLVTEREPRSLTVDRSLQAGLGAMGLGPDANLVPMRSLGHRRQHSSGPTT